MTQGEIITFEKPTADRLLAAMRWVERQPAFLTREARRPVGVGPARREWFQIVTRLGAGRYLVERREWNHTSHQFADLAVTGDPEYGRELEAWDVTNLDSDDLIGETVPGYRTHVGGGEWIILLELGGSTRGNNARVVVREPFHYASATGQTVDDVWRIGGCSNAWIVVMAEFRECTGDGKAATHPGEQDAIYMRELWHFQNAISTWRGGGVSGWMPLTFVVVDKDGDYPPDGWNGLELFLECQIAASGDLSFRVRNETGSTRAGVWRLRAEITSLTSGLDLDELGTWCCHEGAAHMKKWGDGVWDPA